MIGSKTQKTIQIALNKPSKNAAQTPESWEMQVQNRLIWRKVIFKATGCFEKSRLEHATLKRDLWKGNITEHVTELTCGQ